MEGGMFSPYIKGEPRQSQRSLLTLFSRVVSLAGRESRRLKSNTLTLSLGSRGRLRVANSYDMFAFQN